MNLSKVKEFQSKHGTALRTFLASDVGVATLQMMRDMRMDPICDSLPHAAHYRLGSIAGYEQCERHLQYLSTVIPDKPEVEMNYGIRATSEEK